MAEFADLLGCCEAERRLLYAAYSGRQLDFSGGKSDADRTLRGNFLRRLLREKGGFGTEGLRVVGAVITEALDLTDLAGDLAPLPPLSFEQCHFKQEIDLGHAHLARLSLAGSVFSKLNLRNARIAGQLNLRQVHAGDFPTCWVDARDCRIEGGLDANGARLAARAPPAERPPNTEMEYALWLRNAQIEGSLYLSQGFQAIGGVHLGAAHVRGTVWARGARLVGSWDDAFHLQNVRIGANLVMDRGKDGGPPFDARGAIWMMGARIEGIAQLDDATVDAHGGTQRATWHEVEYALQAESIEVGTDLRLVGARIRGRLNLTSSRIRGALQCSGLRIWRPSNGDSVFAAGNLDVAGNADFERAVVLGGLDLLGATIGGSLRCRGATLVHRGGQYRSAALCAINAKIGENAVFRSAPAAPGCAELAQEFQSRGALDFTGAAVSGALLFRNAYLVNRYQGWKSAALKAERARIEGSIQIRDTVAVGEINLAGTTVGKNVDCKQAVLRHPERSAFYARDLRVGCDIQFIETRVFGNMELGRAEITGQLVWTDLELGLDGFVRSRDSPAGDGPLVLNLQHARVATTLQANALAIVGDARIDLGGARFSTIEGYWPQGWGSAREGPAVPINFDGLIYDRLVVFADGEMDSAERRAKALVDWLVRQRSAEHHAGTDFFPQPYRQLARILRAQGEEDAARLIAVAEQDVRRGRSHRVGDSVVHRLCRRLIGWISRPLHHAYGALFGYGLKPWRAFLTLLVYAVIGMVGVRAAQRHGLLIERAIPVAMYASAAAPHDGKPVFRAVPLAGKGDQMTADLACTDAAVDVWDDLAYALDMILPFIQLHQEAKCEIRPELEFWPVVCRILRDIYAIVGWLISSLALLTVSGVLRRSDDAGVA